MAEENQEDRPEGSGSSGARQLFGTVGGAKPWDAPQSEREVEPSPTVPPPKDTASAPYPRDASYTPRPPEPIGELETLLGPLDDEGELTKLHPNYKLLMHIAAIVIAFAVFAVAAVVELVMAQNTELPTGLVLAPAALLALFIAIRIPLARYNARGFQISIDRLRVVRGILFRADTVVPFGRVQHIDVDQGPIERALDIATLTLHTAGSHNSSVRLPGLGHALAVEMRESIRAHIKRETM